MPPLGHIFWLCGLSGAGKSTMAALLLTALRGRGIAVLGLDGDALRAGVCLGLGFSSADRSENLRRAACIAALAEQSGLCTVASLITPLESQRQLVRNIMGSGKVSIIYVDASYAVCRQRDVKGLYARAATGQVANFTGLSDVFEPPADADLVLHTGTETIEESAVKLLEFVLAKLEAART
jgi:adenylylsulfate kinase